MKIDLDDLKSLMELMREHRVSEFEHSSDGESLRISLEPEGGVVIPAAIPLDRDQSPQALVV